MKKIILILVLFATVGYSQVGILHNYFGRTDVAFYVNSYETGTSISALDSSTVKFRRYSGAWKMTFYDTAGDSLFSVTTSGNIISTGGYLNFSNTEGSSGFGIRNNSGDIEYKDFGGSWVALNTFLTSLRWDQIANPNTNDEIDFSTYVIELNVDDFRVGDGGSNYWKFSNTGELSNLGTATINLAANTDLLIASSQITITDLASFTKANLETVTSDVSDYAEADGDTYTGAHDFGGATSVEIPNGTNPTTDAAGEIAIDTDDNAIEYYNSTFSVSMLNSSIGMAGGLIYTPDQINDEIPILHVDAAKYPHGIKIINVQITLPSDAAYSMVFEEWAGDPPAAQNDIETVTTGGSDSYMEVTLTDIDDQDIDADDYIFIDVPATDVDWIYVLVMFYIKEGD